MVFLLWQEVDEMALGFEFVLMQIAISVGGYIAHQYFNFPFQRVLGAATAISIVAPLITLDLQNVNIELIPQIVQQYAVIIPEQVVGFVIGSIVTAFMHAIVRILERFGIQLR